MLSPGVPVGTMTAGEAKQAQLEDMQVRGGGLFRKLQVIRAVEMRAFVRGYA